MENNIFGENLRRIREEKGMTQRQLAKQLMVCHQSVCKWETGVVSPQVKWIYPIAEALKIDPKDLFDISRR